MNDCKYYELLTEMDYNDGSTIPTGEACHIKDKYINDDEDCKGCKLYEKLIYKKSEPDDLPF